MSAPAADDDIDNIRMKKTSKSANNSTRKRTTHGKKETPTSNGRSRARSSRKRKDEVESSGSSADGSEAMSSDEDQDDVSQQLANINFSIRLCVRI